MDTCRTGCGSLKSLVVIFGSTRTLERDKECLTISISISNYIYNIYNKILETWAEVGNYQPTGLTAVHEKS